MEDLHQLKLTFENTWPIARLESLTLQEYTNLNKESSFCYWLESRTSDLGSIWGGSAFKFGIYEKHQKGKNYNASGRASDDEYAWMSKYGNSREIVFENIKSLILTIVYAAKKGEIDKIDAIDLGDAVKWKIAQLYSNNTILNIFKKDRLIFIANSLEIPVILGEPFSILQQKILATKPIDKDFFEFSTEMWQLSGEPIRKIWLYAPGVDAYKWDEFNTEQIMALGWDLLEDLGSYKNKSEISSALFEAYGGKTDKKNDTLANEEFYRHVQIGDIVIVKKGTGVVLGFGEVTSDYFFAEERVDYKHCRKVSWLKKGSWAINTVLPLKTLTNFTLYKNSDGSNYAKSLIELMETDKGKKIKHPKNQILYGPPGTGKTFNTINMALEIIGENLKEKSRKEVKKLFDAKMKSGEIVFTTFHQSMGYEDFIEGIKPQTVNEKVLYEIEPGIFKRICDKAISTEGNFDDVLAKFKERVSAGLGAKPLTIHSKATYFDIEYRGTNVFYVQPHNSTKQNPWYPVNIENIRKAFETGSYEGIYNATYVREIISFLEREDGLKKKTNGKKKPYVLIIDEINRGNVSSIFGELITCIEDSKRLGKDEAIEVTLPYSKTDFGVPDNVYIIGTMNTADRSVEALDTALRRRFGFTEMLPRPELLSPSRLIWQFWWDNVDVDWDNEKFINDEDNVYKFLGADGLANLSIDEKEKIWQRMKEGNESEEVFNGYQFNGLNLEKLLETINKRLEKLLSRDHTVGHSFFINVMNVDDLHDAFYNKIIPLLQEYFFGDYGKIGLVLGDAFVSLISNQTTEDKFFAKFEYEEKDMLFEKKVYRINKFDKDYSNFLTAVANI